MKPPRGSKRALSRARLAFTLVEVLVALTLTSLVLTLVGRMAVGSLRSRTMAGDALAKLRREAYLFDRLMSDVDHLLRSADAEKPSLSLYGAPLATLQVHVLSTVPQEKDALHVPWRPATVYYRLRRAADPAAGYELLRESLDETQPEARLQRETIAAGLERFDIEILHDRDWVRRYPPVAGKPKEIRALRITYRWTGEDVATLRTIVLREGV